MASDPCAYCRGSGETSCDSCGGRGGRFARRYQSLDFAMTRFGTRTQWEGCGRCEGSGKVRCRHCDGRVTPEHRQAVHRDATDTLARGQRAIRRILEDPWEHDLLSSRSQRWLAALDRLEAPGENPFQILADLQNAVDEQYAIATPRARDALLEIVVHLGTLQRALHDA